LYPADSDAALPEMITLVALGASRAECAGARAKR